MTKEQNTLIERPPIVTIMGHVDHGKTTLLDAIRKTNVAAREKGGITQAIGAHQIEVNTKEGKRKITFIDTPGHAAFAKMRSRGANITDIVILVVSGADGVMPQTKESIDHIKEANVPTIVAINKVDLPGVNIEKVKKQLSENGILVEGYGGNTVAVPVSGKTGQGIDALLEMIILLAEMEDIKGNPEGLLEAPIIESRLDPRKGPTATAIIKNGTAKIGDQVIAGGVKGKIKAMIDDKGKNLKVASLSTPVEVLGLEAVPDVGSILEKVDQVNKLEITKIEKGELVSVKEANKNLETAKLNIILKADVLGSLEAIIASLPQGVNTVTSGTGDISESDVLLAKSSEGIIVGFNVKLPSQVAKLAEEEKVFIKTYDIIYELLKEIEEAGTEEEKVEETKGEAQIIAEFPYEKKRIAGCRITKGTVARGDYVRIERTQKEVGSGRIKSIRRRKEDVPKAEVGSECGIIIEPEVDFLIGDMLISLRIKGKA